MLVTNNSSLTNVATFGKLNWWQFFGNICCATSSLATFVSNQLLVTNNSSPTNVAKRNSPLKYLSLIPPTINVAKHSLQHFWQHCWATIPHKLFLTIGDKWQLIVGDQKLDTNSTCQKWEQIIDHQKWQLVVGDQWLVITEMLAAKIFQMSINKFC